MILIPAAKIVMVTVTEVANTLQDAWSMGSGVSFVLNIHISQGQLHVRVRLEAVLIQSMGRILVSRELTMRYMSDIISIMTNRGIVNQEIYIHISILTTFLSIAIIMWIPVNKG